MSAAAATAEGSAQGPGSWDLRNWFYAIEMPRLLKVVANVLVDRVSFKTWCLPEKGPADLERKHGISVRAIARAAGYSMRSVRRGLRGLEEIGVLVSQGRAWLPNFYQLVVDRIQVLAKLGHAEPMPDPDDVEMPAEQPREKPVLAVGSSRWTPWVLETARKQHIEARLVVQLVGGTVAAIEGADPGQACGTEARPVLKLWKALDRPAAAAWLDAMARFRAEAGTVEEAWRLLRRRRDLVARWLRAVLAGEKAGRLGEDAPPAPAPAAVVAAAEASAPEFSAVAPAELVAWWNSVQDRAQVALGERDHAIWIKPCKPIAVQGDAVVLSSPNQAHADFVQTKLLLIVSEAVGRPLRIFPRRP